jgi:hypothetical protein
VALSLIPKPSCPVTPPTPHAHLPGSHFMTIAHFFFFKWLHPLFPFLDPCSLLEKGRVSQ